ncbi:MAG: dTDP-4-dehydrorhamnose 3,5-epimerase [Clostridia bacterium]|nr:dTDP-4-dehydrorhamnose 3,5-epimerase [Clostridia bacterium]
MSERFGNFTFHKTEIEGVIIVEPTVYGDSRGYFTETYQKENFIKGGINVEFVQDNQSMSVKGVLRGLHFQKNFPQSKLVRCIRGAVYDVAVDLREGSPTYGKYVGIELSAENKRQFFIPKNFAHGFLVLSDEAEFAYKVDDFYHPNDEGGLLWNDPDIGIAWPLEKDAEVILSDKDKVNSTLKELRENNEKNKAD